MHSGCPPRANAAIWKAQCKPGMVMTDIEIVVGGTCHNQCKADGRPLAAYRILCSQLKTGKPINMQRSDISFRKRIVVIENLRSNATVRKVSPDGCHDASGASIALMPRRSVAQH